MSGRRILAAVLMGLPAYATALAGVGHYAYALQFRPSPAFSRVLLVQLNYAGDPLLPRVATAFAGRSTGVEPALRGQSPAAGLLLLPPPAIAVSTLSAPVAPVTPSSGLPPAPVLPASPALASSRAADSQPASPPVAAPRKETTDRRETENRPGAKPATRPGARSEGKEREDH